MADLIRPLSAAIALLARLRQISGKIKDAEFSNLLAELNINLSDARVENAALFEENATLKRRIRELEGLDGEKCPSCRKMGWRLVDSQPDRTFGELGGIRRTYKCSECGLSESKLVR